MQFLLLHSMMKTVLNMISRVQALELNGQLLLTRAVKLDVARERGAYTPNTRYVVIYFFHLLILILQKKYSSFFLK